MPPLKREKIDPEIALATEGYKALSHLRDAIQAIDGFGAYLENATVAARLRSKGVEPNAVKARLEGFKIRIGLLGKDLGTIFYGEGQAPRLDNPPDGGTIVAPDTKAA